MQPVKPKLTAYEKKLILYACVPFYLCIIICFSNHDIKVILPISPSMANAANGQKQSAKEHYLSLASS